MRIKFCGSGTSDSVFSSDPLTLTHHPPHHPRLGAQIYSGREMAVETRVEPRTSFGSFSHLLDARILRALADMGFAHPTLIQEKSIPLALENRDILARARTGSGKTAAYCIPLVQKILNAKPAVGAPLQLRYISNGLMTPCGLSL